MPPSFPTLRCISRFVSSLFSFRFCLVSFVLCRPSRLVSVGTLWAGRSGLVVVGWWINPALSSRVGERVWCPSVGFGREAAGRAGLVELAGRAARWVEHLRSRLVAAQSSILVTDRQHHVIQKPSSAPILCVAPPPGWGRRLPDPTLIPCRGPHLRLQISTSSSPTLPLPPSTPRCLSVCPQVWRQLTAANSATQEPCPCMA